ncbi:MAG: GNAT family N-acetyltransferase, partial [Planctomycetes bacterium]|nr:GNAT family N-acetyltransferase [Planctomycetota bacterium]
WQARGVGSALFREAVRWSTAKGCRRLKAETQNNNVGACKFYRRQGCRLGQVQFHAYEGVPALADKVMLIWYRDLGGA